MTRLLATAAAIMLIAACGPSEQAAEDLPVEVRDETESVSTRPSVAEGEVTLDVIDGRVFLEGNRAPRDQILQRLAARQGFELVMLSPLSGTFTGYLRDASVADAVSRLVGSTPYTAVYAADREPTDRSILVTLRIGGKSLSRADASVLQRAPDELSLVASNATTSEVNARLLNEWQIENFDHDRELNASDPRERMRALDAVYPAGGALVMLDAMLQFDVDPDVRIAAVHKLDESSSMIARASILKSLNDPDPEVVSETVRIIVDWDDEEFIPRYLEPLLAHPDARIREQIADFLEFLE